MASVNVNVSAGRNTVPVQSLLSYSVNDNVPSRFVSLPADETVAESFGNHTCSELVDDDVVTVKHSFDVLSLDAL